MSKKFINLSLMVIILLIGIIYGVTIHKYEVFPYRLIQKTFNYLFQDKLITENINNKEQSSFYNLWSIGIYEGPTPFDLAPPKNITNPVLTLDDINDVDASYIADPFLVDDNGIYYMFFEVFNWKTYQGDIGYAQSNDGYTWDYQKIIIDEPFHLSYPYIFESDNNFFLIPESNKDLSVRLYKAVSMPDKWEYVGNLLSGYHYVDPSIFRYKDKWWLLISTTPEDGVMNLYYSSDLLGEWKAHPMNPIIKLNMHSARAAGRVFTYNDKLFRLAQDNSTKYGYQVFAYEITDLTEKTYAEKIISDKPIVSWSGKGWNAEGMHHADLHKVGDRWIAIADGRNR